MNLSSRGVRGFGRYLEHLIGSYRPWQVNDHDSPPARAIRDAVSDDILDALTPQQRDRLERTLSAALGALRAGIMFRQGMTLRAWRPTNARQPGVRRVEGYGSRFFEWDRNRRGWIDHPYRLTYKREDGTTVERFISEPYQISEEGLRSLVALADEGWSVHLDADWSLHYPGSTLRVVISRKEANR